MGDSYDDFIRFLKEHKYLAEDGAPLKCPDCDSDTLRSHMYKEQQGNQEDVFVSVVETYCANCHQQVGYWKNGEWLV